jgi:hypothetical protein
LRAKEIGRRWISFAFFASRVAAYSIVAVRSVGIQGSTACVTGKVVGSGRKLDADRCSSTVVAGVGSAWRVTAAWFHRCGGVRNSSDFC